MKAITSAANATYKGWLRLATQPRQVRAQRQTLAEGVHLCEAVLDAGHRVDAMILRAGSGGDELDRLRARLAGSDAPQYELAAALYDALGLVEHGVGLTLVLHVPPQTTSNVAADVLYLDGIQDPGNAGALLRVAAAAGVRHVFASSHTAALWAPKVMRAAQGAHLRLDLREQVEPLRMADASVYWIGTDVHSTTSLWQADLPAGPVGWVVGAEGQGASAAALEACALRVRIPLASGVESLNVASAAAVCLFERQRRLGRGAASG